MKLLVSLILLINLYIVKSELVVTSLYYNNEKCQGEAPKIEIYSQCNLMGRIELIENSTRIAAYGHPQRIINSKCTGYTDTIFNETRVGECSGGGKSIVNDYPSYIEAWNSLPMNTCNQILLINGCDENYLITSFAKDSCNFNSNENGVNTWLKASCTQDEPEYFICSDSSCTKNCFPENSPRYKKGNQCQPGLNVNSDPVDYVSHIFLPKLPSSPTIKPTTEPTMKPTVEPTKKPASDELIFSEEDISDTPNDSNTVIYSVALLITCLLFLLS